MKKYSTYAISLLVAVGLACTEAKAASMGNAIEASTVEATSTATAAEITIKVTGQNVRITGASGKTLEVYSITGAKVTTIAIDANDKTVTLSLTRGWYILKVGTVTRKVAIL